MFSTFLNKDSRHCLDLSIFVNYSPDQLLFYYYNTTINISLETYLQMQEWLANSLGNPDNLSTWIDFINEEIVAGPGLEELHMSDYLNSIGPYYYVPTNTQFHFTRFYSDEHDFLTSADLAHLFSYHKLPHIDRALQKYAQSRKSNKKALRSKEELLRDISMCSASLRKIAILDQHILYINKFIEQRRSIFETADLAPTEPNAIPVKPQKPAEPQARFSLLDSIALAKRRTKPGSNSDYSHMMKIYFIKSREYEKACERYKNALQDWQESRETFVQKCVLEVQEATSTLKDALELKSTYQGIIRKSYIHSDYQNVDTLNKFQYYLETGRADDLQGCMNIFEIESHWEDVKAGQERIETTIYHLQPDNEALYYTNQEVNELIASTLE
ncbi:MAG: hypothetical protein ABRQ24_07420 [Syntrophomonadaceae bacterium]